LDERPIKLKRNQKFAVVGQCLADEAKFIATSELILEPIPTKQKKRADDESLAATKDFRPLRDRLKIVSFQDCSIIATKLNYMLAAF
jgi:hypothetical protein